MGERVYSWNGDWKFKTDRAMDFKNMIRSRGCTISNLAKICGLTSGGNVIKVKKHERIWGILYRKTGTGYGRTNSV